ncbi:hypothetical protein [Methanomassiliicoccus luminyensis]|uniref:hypothetical protein n=1 Tax=Methanomassiliicoccus luminyensis TaxID=1080712 RepID=UPI0004745826|nr:hypothetical protein [Methanomassiliicoccus luminyensis]
MGGIQKSNGTFRQLWRVTGLQEHELEGELEVLRHLGYVEVVSRTGGGKRVASSRARSALCGLPGAAYRLTEKGKRAFSSFD